MLKISCNSCGGLLFYYQKDGSGILKRSYLDRILGESPHITSFYNCQGCNELLGIYQPYTKEKNRPAIRWFVDALTYKVVSYSQYLKSNPKS